MRAACCLVVAGAVAGIAPVVSAQELRSVSFGDRNRPYIELFADANLKSVLAQSTGANPQTAAASLGLMYRTGSVVGNLLVNAIGQSGPVRRNVGASLLAPAAGPSLSAGLLDLALRISSLGPLCQDLGLHAYGSVSSAKWAYTPSNGSEREYGAVIGGAGGTVRCVMFSGPLSSSDAGSSSDGGENRVAAYLEAGSSFRTIGGEIADATNDAVRFALLGTVDKPQWGVEATFGLEFNGVKAALTYYGFQNDVRGMSGGQVLAGFSVQSALFRGFLDRRRPEYVPPRRRR
jgi:hypothetical protein